MDFGLSRFDTAHRTQRLPLPEISADPASPLTLIVAQIHLGNSRYNAWLLKHAAPDPATIPADGTPERREYEDSRTAAMLGAVSIVDWENVLCDAGSAPYSPENATEFLLQLRAARLDVFRRIAAFAIDPANWTTGTTPPTDTDALGKG